MTLEELDALLEECLASGLLEIELDAESLPRVSLTAKGADYLHRSDHDPEGEAKGSPPRTVPGIRRTRRAAAARSLSAGRTLP